MNYEETWVFAREQLEDAAESLEEAARAVIRASAELDLGGDLQRDGSAMNAAFGRPEDTTDGLKLAERIAQISQQVASGAHALKEAERR